MIIFSGTDKKRIIDLIEQNMKEFIYPGVSDPGPIIAHIEWMRRQRAELNVTCRLETFPANEATQIVIMAQFRTPSHA